jgi:hypothetical protein
MRSARPSSGRLTARIRRGCEISILLCVDEREKRGMDFEVRCRT